MMKKFALAASMTMLIALPGQAFAGTAAPHARYWPQATRPSDRQALDAYNAYDPAFVMPTVAPNAYRYHGGPKYND